MGSDRMASILLLIETRSRVISDDPSGSPLRTTARRDPQHGNIIRLTIKGENMSRLVILVAYIIYLFM